MYLYVIQVITHKSTQPDQLNIIRRNRIKLRLNIVKCPSILPLADAINHLLDATPLC